MKLKLLILALLFPLASFGANTNLFNNVLINNNLQYIAGTPGVGKALISDASGNAVWTTIATGGDVFTTSNNTFIVGKTNTFNGVTLTSNLTVQGSALFMDGTTIGDAAGDAVTMNSSTMAIPNNWNVGSSALFVSNAVGFVGIGTNVPTTRLQINGAVLATQMGASNNASFMANAGSGVWSTAGNSNYVFASFFGDNVTPNFGIQAQTNINFRNYNNSSSFVFIQNGTTRASIGASQNFFNRVFIGSGQNGVAVGSSTISNSMISGFSGTYGGASTTIVFAATYQQAPQVTITKTESGGTTLLNDQAWVTNTTTTNCVVGFRDSAGGQSAGTFSFNGIAFGLKGN